MRRPRRGMTMAELLTVVAVITILASMMSPILLRAQKESTRRACMANLSQIHMGLQLIANDNFGKLPPCFETKNNAVIEDTWWFVRVARKMYPTAKYLNEVWDHLNVPPPNDLGGGSTNRTWWQKASQAHVELLPFDPNRTILRCPASRDYYDQRYDKSRTNADSVEKDRVFDDNYGYSNWGFRYVGSEYGQACTVYYLDAGEFFEHSRLYHTGNDRSHGGYNPDAHPIRGHTLRRGDGALYNPDYARIGELADYPDPAGTVLMMDYIKADIAMQPSPSMKPYDYRGDINVDGENRHYPDGARFRHGDRANVLFLDGRIEGFRDRNFRRLVAEGQEIHWTVKRVP